MSHGPADGGDHLGRMSSVGIAALCAPAGKMDVILRAEIPAEPWLALGLFFFQLFQKSGAVLGPEAVVVNMAVIGRKQGFGGLLGLVHDI